MLDIDVQMQGLLDALEKSGHDIAPAVEAGLDRAAQVVLQRKHRELNKTYARAIPKSKNGKPKWKRSGDWIADQGITREPGHRTVSAIGKSEAYEERLATLPTGPDGINRSNPAAERAYDKTEPQIAAIVEQEILNALNL